MNAIWKFQIPVDFDFISLSAPLGARFLPRVHAADEDTLSLWAEIETDVPVAVRTFKVVATGQPYAKDHSLEYVGTAITQSELVWHVFEVLA